MSVSESKSHAESQDVKVQNALTRSTLYQFLSLCFFEPDQKTIPILKSDEYLGNVQESLDEYLTVNSFNGNVSSAKGSLKLLADYFKEKSFEDLSSEYDKIFGSFTAAKECPIYETLYGSTTEFQQSQNLQELADIGGFYRAFELKLSEDMKERYDHLSIELEFMHFLTYKEAYALENHGEEQLKICTDAEKKFLKSHLARWVPLFATLVNKRAKLAPYNDTGKCDAYLGNAANLLRDFISFESKLFKIKVEEATELNTEAAMKDEEFQCGPGTCEAIPNAKGTS